MCNEANGKRLKRVLVPNLKNFHMYITMTGALSANTKPATTFFI